MTEYVGVNVCVECGAPNDERTKLGALIKAGHKVSGHISICFSCKHIAIWNADLSLREPTVDEVIAIHNDPKIKQALYAIEKVKKEIANEARRLLKDRPPPQEKANESSR